MSAMDSSAFAAHYFRNYKQGLKESHSCCEFLLFNGFLYVIKYLKCNWRTSLFILKIIYYLFLLYKIIDEFLFQNE